MKIILRWRFLRKQTRKRLNFANHWILHRSFPAPPAKFSHKNNLYQLNKASFTSSSLQNPISLSAYHSLISGQLTQSLLILLILRKPLTVLMLSTAKNQMPLPYFTEWGDGQHSCVWVHCGETYEVSSLCLQAATFGLGSSITSSKNWAPVLDGDRGRSLRRCFSSRAKWKMSFDSVLLVDSSHLLDGRGSEMT